MKLREWVMGWGIEGWVKGVGRALGTSFLVLSTWFLAVSSRAASVLDRLVRALVHLRIEMFE
jgi:hypothetical protein